MSEITVERLQILGIVKKLSHKNKYGVADIKNIMTIIIKERNIKQLSVRKQVSECKKMGLLENPITGGWKLTDKGKNILAKMITDQVRSVMSKIK